GGFRRRRARHRLPARARRLPHRCRGGHRCAGQSAQERRGDIARALFLRLFRLPDGHAARGRPRSGAYCPGHPPPERVSAALALAFASQKVTTSPEAAAPTLALPEEPSSRKTKRTIAPTTKAPATVPLASAIRRSRCARSACVWASSYRLALRAD